MRSEKGNVIATDFPGLSERACENERSRKKIGNNGIDGLEMEKRCYGTEGNLSYVRAIADRSRTTCQGRRQCKPRSTPD